MSINKICIALIVLVAVIGIVGSNSNNNAVNGEDTYIPYNQSNVGLFGLTTTITLTIKNNENHEDYFKISNVYTGSLTDNSTIKWIIDSTSPSAKQMVDAVNPQLGGDWGWKLNAGQTKTVSFTMHAVGDMGIDAQTDNAVIVNEGAAPNIYWPIVPDPGIYSSWFQPNEIETLNPQFDLKSWKGRFSFMLHGRENFAGTVSGIIRAPIVPVGSALTYSNPKVTYKDNSIVMGGSIAAWDVTIGTGQNKGPYTYTYVWPDTGSNSTGTGTYTSPTVSAASTANTPSTTGTKQTGVPYVPFAVGGLLAAGGLVYARFMR